LSAADSRALLAIAEAAAREAGSLLLRAQALARSDVATKSSETDMVTDADRASERMIVEYIRGRRPHDAILGEEGIAETPSETSDVQWAIDPLDGTTNYMYRHPFFAVSIGVQVKGTTYAGVVHDPTHGETFTAVRDGGAFLNGSPIRVSGKSDLSTALIGTGFSYLPDQRGPQAAALHRVIPHVRDIRRHGAAALDLCWVACGRLDAYYERWLGGLWDLCAGDLIVQEAGGLTSAIEGGLAVPQSVLAGTPALVEPLRSLLREE
jgi:myo-inositol-1(or 4)-monophosphatase